MNFRSVCVLLPALAFAAGAAMAVPTTSTDVSASDETGGAPVPARPAPGLVGAGAAPAAPGNSRTIQMLLEMQEANPTLEAGERQRHPRRAVAVDPSRARSTADEAGHTSVPSPYAATLETSAANQPPKRPPGVADWRASLAAQNAGGAAPQTNAGGSEPAYATGPAMPSGRPTYEIDEWLSMPAALIRFVRQNRGLVLLGGLAVLGLAWGLTAISGRWRH